MILNDNHSNYFREKTRSNGIKRTFTLWLIISFSLFLLHRFFYISFSVSVFALVGREIADHESYLSNQVVKYKFLFIFLFIYIIMMEIPSFKCTYPILREIYYIRNIKKYLFKFKMNNYFNYWYFKWWNIEEKSFVPDRRPFDSIIDWKLIGIMKHAKQYSLVHAFLFLSTQHNEFHKNEKRVASTKKSWNPWNSLGCKRAITLLQLSLCWIIFINKLLSKQWRYLFQF